MTEKLKPCLFCGSVGLFIETYILLDRTKVVRVTCGKCEASGPPVAFVEDAKMEGVSTELWNRRNDVLH